MNPLRLAPWAIAALSLAPLSCTTTEGEQVNISDPYESYKPEPFGSESYLHLGEKRSATTPYLSELTVFVKESDPSPRCPGCRALRVVYQPKGPGEMPVTHIRLDLADACDAASPDDPVALPTAQGESGGPIVFDANPFACDQDGEVGIELLGKACADAEDPACEDLEVKKVLKAKILDVRKLKPVPHA